MPQWSAKRRMASHRKGRNFLGASRHPAPFWRSTPPHYREGENEAKKLQA
jgi:hypothetical protein